MRIDKSGRHVKLRLRLYFCETRTKHSACGAKPRYYPNKRQRLIIWIGAGLLRWLQSYACSLIFFSVLLPRRSRGLLVWKSAYPS